MKTFFSGLIGFFQLLYIDSIYFYVVTFTLLFSISIVTTCAAIIFGMASLKKSVRQIKPRRHHYDIVHELHFEVRLIVIWKGYTYSFI